MSIIDCFSHGGFDIRLRRKLELQIDINVSPNTSLPEKLRSGINVKSAKALIEDEHKVFTFVPAEVEMKSAIACSATMPLDVSRRGKG